MYDEITEEREIELIDKIAKFVVKNGMASPSILFLETFKSLSWLGGNYALMFVEPFLPCYREEGNEIIQALGNIKNIKLLIKRIEEITEQNKKENERKGEGESIGLLIKVKYLIKRLGGYL